MRRQNVSDANFLTVFHSNYGSILLSFRDTTTRQTTDRQTSHICLLADRPTDRPAIRVRLVYLGVMNAEQLPTVRQSKSTRTVSLPSRSSSLYAPSSFIIITQLESRHSF